MFKNIKEMINNTSGNISPLEGKSDVSMMFKHKSKAVSPAYFSSITSHKAENLLQRLFEQWYFRCFSSAKRGRRERVLWEVQEAGEESSNGRVDGGADEGDSDYERRGQSGCDQWW